MSKTEANEKIKQWRNINVKGEIMAETIRRRQNSAAGALVW